MNDGTLKRTGTIGHVDHGKTTLTAAITFTAAAMADKPMEPGIYGYMNDGTFHKFFAQPTEEELNQMVLDGNGPVAVFVITEGNDQTEEQVRSYIKRLTFGARYGGGAETLATGDQLDVERPMTSRYDDVPYAFAAPMESMSADRRGKSGKDKSSRKFPLPPRRL